MPAKKKAAKKQPARKAASKPASQTLIPEQLAPLVMRLRRENVILDSDIAELYGIPVGQLNQAVKRNLDRFPPDFMFQLTEEELENLKSQFVISSSGAASLRSQSATLKPGRGQHHAVLHAVEFLALREKCHHRGRRVQHARLVHGLDAEQLIKGPGRFATAARRKVAGGAVPVDFDQVIQGQ